MIHPAKIACFYSDCGLNPIPAEGKHPAIGKWKELQNRRLTAPEIPRHFKQTSGIGTICGLIAGGLEVYDIDNKDGNANVRLLVLLRALEAEGYGDLVSQLVIVATPSGGFHLHTRYVAPAGNCKLAQRKAAGKIIDLIETRGEGGFIMLPGGAVTHPSGRAYRQLNGSFRSIPVLSFEQRELLMSTAAALNEVTQEERPQPISSLQRGARRVGDDFAHKVNIAVILKTHGWKYLGNGKWQAPGKHHNPVSAVEKIFNGKHVLKVWTSSAPPLEFNRCYNAFQIETFLAFAGDFRAAAKALAARGYGAQS